MDACQIPESVLQSVSTERLIRLCLDYPMLIGFRVFDQLSDGVDAVYNSFNGFRELTKRPEAVDILSALYQEELEKQNDILNNSVVPLLTKGKYKIRVSNIEIFMGCPQMQVSLTEAKRKQVVSTLMKGYQKKYESPAENKKIEFESNVYARANAIDSSLLSTPEMKRLTRSVGTLAEPVENLDVISNQLIQK